MVTGTCYCVYLLNLRDLWRCKDYVHLLTDSTAMHMVTCHISVVYDVVMIRRINSKGSHGNDYVLANTTISTALQQLSNSITQTI